MGVELSKGSVVATIKIDEPTKEKVKSTSTLTDKLKSSSTLTEAVAKKIKAVKGIDAVESGSVVVSKTDLEADVAGLDTEKICKEVSQELKSNAEVEKRDQDD